MATTRRSATAPRMAGRRKARARATAAARATSTAAAKTAPATARHRRDRPAPGPAAIAAPQARRPAEPAQAALNPGPRRYSRRMATPSTQPPRTALLAGATGLVGRELLALLLAHPAYAHVHLLLRRATNAIDTQPRLSTRAGRLHAPRRAAAGRRCLHRARHDDQGRRLGSRLPPGRFRLRRRHREGGTRRRGRTPRRSSPRSAPMRTRASSTTASRARCRTLWRSWATPASRIAQPSLLVGNRAALGQPVRAGEVWATRLLGPVMALVPRAVRPIAAQDVAAALIAATLDARPGRRVLRSGQMQGAGRR